MKGKSGSTIMLYLNGCGEHRLVFSKVFVFKIFQPGEWDIACIIQEACDTLRSVNAFMVPGNH